jgi:hypothetical protein
MKVKLCNMLWFRQRLETILFLEILITGNSNQRRNR